MTSASFTLRRLLFAGENLDDAWVAFQPGLNIIYGGSNAGKSFTLRAIDFMLGADRLRLPKQGERYSTIFLWLDLPDGTQATLQRRTWMERFWLQIKKAGVEEIQRPTAYRRLCFSNLALGQLDSYETSQARRINSLFAFFLIISLSMKTR
jgi:hypothetical protein